MSRADVLKPNVSAYVPCFNNAATLRRAVESILAQTHAPAEVIVIDDGSSDASVEQVNGLPVRVVRHGENLGRGAARERAMREAAHDMVLCCDATNVLPGNFVEQALPFFKGERVAAVYGRITQHVADGVVARWRGRHLFKMDRPQEMRRHALLNTGGTLVRGLAVRAAGGYQSALRHNEDADLGRNLLRAGYEVIYEPALPVVSLAPAALGLTLERYWRWYAGTHEAVSWAGYWRNIGYAVKAMAAEDIRAGDPLSAGISLLCPHYQFWKSWMRGLKRRGGA